MFSKILVANRGEIACRVINTAQRMGIKTVAIYSEADEFALHTQIADEAICIGPGPAENSYLSIEAVVAACKETQSDAVHPGYGFLSENSKFVEVLHQAGITFIGPPAQAIGTMGDKIASKKLAQKSGVNIVPGFMGVLESSDQALEIAKEIGYPVMLKASAGGGGRGMRVAFNDSDIRQEFSRAASEARSAFGDDRIFVEKYIEMPRHIEIQILADTHGTTIHLGERECSIQRRHQKIIEEAPSPFLSNETREEMGEQAVRLARAVDYCSAGTVEFIVDSKQNFYFLEMNTRLQVEHPVTEFVTGIDLVEQMIRVAAGERLGFVQSDIRLVGWSIEARVYAEDPSRSFLPSTGRLVRYKPTSSSKTIRVDSGVDEGSEISPFYDPLMAKLVTMGADRAEALDTMAFALDSFVIRGVEHNITFLRAVIGSEPFKTGDFSTNLIADIWPEGFKGAAGDLDAMRTAVLVGSFVHFRAILRELQHNLGGWTALVSGQHVRVNISDSVKGCDVELEGSHYEVSSVWQAGEDLCSVTIDDVRYLAKVDLLQEGFLIDIAGVVYQLVFRRPGVAALNSIMPIKKPPDLSGVLLSPMPGLVVSVAVTQGDQVEVGQPLAIIDAMKMENILFSERDGTIRNVHVATGDSLAVDEIILEFE